MVICKAIYTDTSWNHFHQGWTVCVKEYRAKKASPSHWEIYYFFHIVLAINTDFLFPVM